MTMKCECTGCGGDCSQAYGTYQGDSYHFGCIPVRSRRRESSGDVPTPPEGKEGLPIPASQDPLRKLY